MLHLAESAPYCFMFGPQAREEIRVLRAELSVLRMEVTEASVARVDAESRNAELEQQNQQLKLEVANNTAEARSTMEEAVRLLCKF